MWKLSAHGNCPGPKDGLLYFKLLELHDRIAQELSFEYIADEVKVELQRWIEAAQAHRDSEHRLVVTVYDLTLGGEG